NGETTILTDGRKVITENDDSTRVERPDGKIAVTIDKGGHVQQFEYGPDGQIHKFSTPDGVVWESEDGKNWTNANSDKVWKVTVSVAADGTCTLIDEKNGQIILKPDGSTEMHKPNGEITLETADGHRKVVQADTETLDKKAEALVKAMPNDGSVLSRLAVDMDIVMYELRDATDSERKIINDMYKQKTGESLDETFQHRLGGADLEWAQDILKYGTPARACENHADMADGSEKARKDIREMLSQMNSKEIQQLRNDWLQHGYGPPLDEALLQDKNLPESTREVLKVYLKGIDQRDKDDPQFSDTITLANLALKQKDLGLLEETFGEGKASDAARRYFLDRGGEQVIRDIWAPEPGVNYNPRISGRDVRQALDYVKYGHLSLETQAYANDGIFSSHEGAIKDAAKSM